MGTSFCRLFVNGSGFWDWLSSMLTVYQKYQFWYTKKKYLILSVFLDYIKFMKKTVTLEVANNTVLQILRNFAAMHLVKFKDDAPAQEDQMTDRLNEIYKKLDSSIDPFVVMAQSEVLEGDDW